MALPAWFWPPSGGSARGVSLVPFGAGLAVPDWHTPRLWPFSVSGAAFTSATGITLPVDPSVSGWLGLSAAAADGEGGAWTLSYWGQFWQVASGGTVLTSGILPSGAVYVGCAVAGTSAFFLDSDGPVYGTGATVLGAWPTLAKGLVASGTTLFSLLPSSGLGTMDAGTGATGLVAFPAGITTPSCLAAVSGAVAMGGWANSPSLSGGAAAALDPQDPLTLAMVGNSYALLFRSPSASGEAWSQAQSVTGLAALTAMAWTPDGTQVLATDPASGVVQALAYSVGVLSLAQTLAVSGACSVMVAGTSTNALVAQSGQAQVATLTYSVGTWAAGTPLTGVPGVVAVAPMGPTGAVIAYSGALAYAALTTGGWAIESSVALPFVPTALATDQFLRSYVAGSGVVAMVSGGVLAASGILASGTPTAVAAHNGRIMIGIPANTSMYMYGQSDANSLTQQVVNSTDAIGSPVGFGLSSTVLFVMGPSATLTRNFSGSIATGLPFGLVQITSGTAAWWNGSAWTTTRLGRNNHPSCIGFDASGGLLVATVENTFWNIASGGTGTSGAVTPYSGQLTNVPLSLSALFTSGASTYASTLFPGALVELT